MDYRGIYGDFFKGRVKFLKTGFINGQYSIVSNGAIIKVKNSAHVRLIDNQYGNFPETFEIIAPLDGVKCVSGDIPDYYIQHLPASEYLEYRRIYQGI